MRVSMIPAKARMGWKPVTLVIEEDSFIRGAVLLLVRPVPGLGGAVLYAPRGPVVDFHDEEALDALLEGANAQEQRAVPRGKGEIPAAMGHKKGVVAREDRAREDLAVFYKLLVKTAIRDNFLARSRTYFEDMWDLLVTPSLARLFLAECAGECIAGAITFRFAGKVWYVYGASGSRHRNVMPNHALQWRMIRWAMEHGAGVYDFRSVSGDLHPGVRQHPPGPGAGDRALSPEPLRMEPRNGPRRGGVRPPAGGKDFRPRQGGLRDE